MIKSKYVGIGLVLLYIVFLFWYGGIGKPLNQAEIDEHIAAIKAVQGDNAEKGEEILMSLQNILQNDDGKSFYMVNLIKYKNSTNADDISQANSRYSSNMLPILLMLFLFSDRHKGVSDKYYSCMD